MGTRITHGTEETDKVEDCKAIRSLVAITEIKILFAYVQVCFLKWKSGERDTKYTPEWLTRLEAEMNKIHGPPFVQPGPHPHEAMPSPAGLPSSATCERPVAGHRETAGGWPTGSSTTWGCGASP